MISGDLLMETLIISWVDIGLMTWQLKVMHKQGLMEISNVWRAALILDDVDDVLTS